MSFRINQLENQVKQLKANNKALKAKTGSKGTGNVFKKHWNNAGKQPGNSKGKKNFPPKKTNPKFTKKTKPSGNGSAQADQLICWKCNRPGHMRAACPHLMVGYCPHDGSEWSLLSSGTCTVNACCDPSGSNAGN